MITGVVVLELNKREQIKKRDRYLLIMVSKTLIKLSSPVARSCLIALSATLVIDAILTIIAAVQYPYLIDHNNDDLYISSSRTIPIVYSGVAFVAFLIAISTAVACYKNATTYILIHAGITGVFLPVSILVYFTTSTTRYKVQDYAESFTQMIEEYKISGSHRKTNPDGSTNQNTQYSNADPSLRPKIILTSFRNLMDSLQTKFSCCGIDSVQDWSRKMNNFIAPTCCKEPISSVNLEWASIFKVNSDHEFKHCRENDSYHLGCMVALKEDEHSKFAWLSDLIVFMIVITLANTVVSLLLFGLIKTEDNVYEGNECELSIVGASAQPGTQLPTITSIKHRPSVVQTIGNSTENIAARAHAVRFNLSNSPRTSISGPSKFSAGARRGSSFI